MILIDGCISDGTSLVSFIYDPSSKVMICALKWGTRCSLCVCSSPELSSLSWNYLNWKTKKLEFLKQRSLTMPAHRFQSSICSYHRFPLRKTLREIKLWRMDELRERTFRVQNCSRKLILFRGRSKFKEDCSEESKHYERKRISFTQ